MLVNITSTLRPSIAGQTVKIAFSDEDLGRFWSKVDQNAKGGCWLWTASTFVKGGQRWHGQFTVRRDGVQYHLSAHRLAWEFLVGPIPSDRKVLHNCPGGDNAQCCNPAHLWLGSQQDNLTDARQKGRLIDGLNARKLTDTAYREILQQPYRQGSGKALALKHGVTTNTISRIRHGLQGSTYHRTVAPVLERVPSVELPVSGILHLERIA